MYNLKKGGIFPNLKCIKSVFISYEQCMNRRTPKNFSLYRKISQATSVPSTTIDQWIPVPEKQESPIEKKWTESPTSGLGFRVRKKSTKTPHANGNPRLAVLENGVINQGKVGSLTGWRGAADSGAAVAASAPCCFGGEPDRGKECGFVRLRPGFYCWRLARWFVVKKVTFTYG